MVKDKLSGELTTPQIREKYNIKNKSQVETWIKWYHNNEFYRFDQPIGKHYTYGHGPEKSSEDGKQNIKKVYRNRSVTKKH